jgi:hypothetical protein
LVGDAGFSSVLVLRQLEAWGRDYVLRQKGKFLLQRPPQAVDEDYHLKQRAAHSKPRA